MDDNNRNPKLNTLVCPDGPNSICERSNLLVKCSILTLVY